MIRLFRQYISLRKWLLVGVQSLLFVGCVYLSAAIRFWSDREELLEYISFPAFALRLLFFVGGVQTCFLLAEYYERHVAGNARDEFALLTKAVGCAGILLGSVYFLMPSLLVGRGVFFISLLMIATTSLLSREVLKRNWHFTKPQRILVLGTGELARLAAEGLASRRDLNLRLTGFLAEPSNDVACLRPWLREKVLGSIAEIESVVVRQRISRIVVAMDERRGMFPAAELVRLRVSGIVVEEVHSTLAALTGHIWLRAVRPSSFVFSIGFHRSKLTMLTKRLLDIVLATTGFVVAIPLMIAVAVVIRLESPGTILYRQTRVGWKGRQFEVLKFRSMRNDAEAHGARWAVSNDPRVTRIGGFIRKYRIDELPQFINIIRGQMSFVGPRPERPKFVDELRQEIPYYDERHSVRPGLTGWAQVRYGYGASVDDATRKLEYDLFYLQNLSILFDCAVVLETIRTVVSGFERRTPAAVPAAASEYVNEWKTGMSVIEAPRQKELEIAEVR